LRAEPHDQEHRLGGGLAKDLVADVDAVGAGELWSLMGERAHEDPPCRLSRRSGLYGTVCRAAGERLAVLTGAPQGCGMVARRSKGPAKGRRKAMADKSSDPVALWQQMIGEMEKGFNTLATQTMTSPEFSKAMNQAGGVTAGAQKQLTDFMEKYLL